MGLKNYKSLFLGIVLGFMVSACASAVFPYHYYGLDLKDGKLLGPTEADNVDLAVCNATSADQSPCIAMITSSFLEMKKDYKDTKNQLIACQQQLAAKQ